MGENAVNNYLDALKKARKNIQRVFLDSDMIEDAKELHGLLSKDSLRSLLLVKCLIIISDILCRILHNLMDTSCFIFQIYSSVVSASTYYVNEEDCTASDLIKNTCEHLQKAMTDSYFTMQEEAEELFRIISTQHLRALGSCIKEIASGNFFTASLPSTGIYVIEGTVNSLPQTVYNDSHRGVYSLNGTELSNGVVNNKSASLNAAMKEEAAKSTNSVPEGVKLTGGGEGLPMKPVDDDELMLISFKRNIGEDLVRIVLQFRRRVRAFGYTIQT